jgi:hypothetical protein
MMGRKALEYWVTRHRAARSADPAGGDGQLLREHHRALMPLHFIFVSNDPIFVSIAFPYRNMGLLY